MREELAENLLIILLAYVAAFLPWTAVSATDFISPTWKTVRATRRAGYTNLLITAIPALYIVFYIILQAAVDYKEMFAAIVALTFSLLHIVRTVWGLWQLRLFARWASRSVRALRALGIPYEFRDPTCVHPRAIADRLLVNDDLIDNQLFHGHARCYLHYDGLDFKTDSSRGGVAYQRIGLLWTLLVLILRYLFSFLTRPFHPFRPPPVRQLPYRPVNVWLRWAVAFAAQGLSTWITDFSVATDPDAHPCHDNLRMYERRRAYFAGKVLASAAMQLWPRADFSLAPTSTISKIDLFWPSVFSGVGLPFGAPQTDIWSARGAAALHSDDPSRTGYRPYARKLARVVEGMPISFGKEIEDFDVEKLEWLTILLNLGTQLLDSDLDDIERFEDDGDEDFNYSQERDLDDHNRNERNTHPDKMSKITSRSTAASIAGALTASSVQASQRTNDSFSNDKGEEQLEDGDLALDNLRRQLGFGPNAPPQSSEKGIASFSAVPLPMRCFHTLSTGNRLVTQAGELIDCWLALVAGDQIRYLLSMDHTWVNRCRGGNFPQITIPLHAFSLVPESPFSRSTASSSSPSSSSAPSSSRHTPSSTSTFKPVHEEEPYHSRNSSHRTNELLRTSHIRIEKARLAYQFSVMHQPHWHMEQTLTFMGHTLESVRTALGKWVDQQQRFRKDGKDSQGQTDSERNAGIEEKEWRPEVFSEGEMKTPWITVGRLPKRLSRRIGLARDKAYFEQRPVQVRLLWELQEMVRDGLFDGAASPHSMRAVILCMLGFPSLAVEVLSDEDQEGEEHENEDENEGADGENGEEVEAMNESEGHGSLHGSERDEVGSREEEEHISDVHDDRNDGDKGEVETAVVEQSGMWWRKRRGRRRRSSSTTTNADNPVALQEKDRVLLFFDDYEPGCLKSKKNKKKIKDEGEMETEEDGAGKNENEKKNKKDRKKKNKKEDGSLAWSMNFVPTCGPQDIVIGVKCVPLEDEKRTKEVERKKHRTTGNVSWYEVKMRLIRGSPECDERFEWEWWRDAAMSRMEGMRQWQRVHEIRSVEMYGTNVEMSEGRREHDVMLKGTGKSFVTWSGWLPFRFEHSRFELESPGFLIHFTSTKAVNFVTGEREEEMRRHRLSRAERRALPYDESDREQLRHCCFVVREVIPDEGRAKREELNESLTNAEKAERLVSEAENVYAEEEADNFDRAVLLLEVAAVELGSLRALRRCVTLLTTSSDAKSRSRSGWETESEVESEAEGTKDIRRAVRLIELCMASQLRSRLGNHARLSSQMEEDYGFRAYHTLFADLVRQTGAAEVTTVPFARYLTVMVSVDERTSIGEVFCWLRRMFVHSRCFDILESMGTAMRSRRVIEDNGTDIDLTYRVKMQPRSRSAPPISLKVADGRRTYNVNALARKLYKRAATEGGCTSAMNELGLQLARGEAGVPQSTTGAYTMFTKACSAGSAMAHYHLGSMLLHPPKGQTDVQRDVERAAFLLRLAVQRGRVAGAMFRLGVLFRDGAWDDDTGTDEDLDMNGSRDEENAVVPRDAVTAARLFERAIKEAHLTRAMVALGKLYEEGSGVEQSTSHAIELYSLAISDGHTVETSLGNGHGNRHGNGHGNEDENSDDTIAEARTGLRRLLGVDNVQVKDMKANLSSGFFTALLESPPSSLPGHMLE